MLSDTDIATIYGMVDDSVSQIHAGNWDAYLDMFTDDCAFFPPGAPPIRGKAACKEFLDAFPDVTAFTSRAEAIDGLGNMAVTQGRFTMTVNTEDGSMSDEGTWFSTAKKNDAGDWKIVWNGWNSDLEPA